MKRTVMLEDTRRLDEVIFVAFDTETTGLVAIAGKLVEVGAVRFRADGQELETFVQLIDPQDPMPLEAQRVHGITDAMVCGQPTVEHVLPSFLDFLGSPDTILLAHNARFDIDFLGVSMLRLGLDFPCHRIVDTLPLAQTRGPLLSNYKLTSLAAALRASQREQHRALADARLVKYVFLGLLQWMSDIGTVVELTRLTTPLTFHDAQVSKIQPPPGFQDLAIALEERRAMAIVYQGGANRARQRLVTPKALLQWNDTAYLAAYCHIDRKDKLFRFDRIRRCWLSGNG
jgi:DNA polymerase III subunit epsilon